MEEQQLTHRSLRSRVWSRFLRGPDAELLEGLYVPALGAALRYDRCCAYFCSSVLAVAARGFGRLIQNLLEAGDDAPKPAVRLIVNEELSPQDVDALLSQQDNTALTRKLLRRLIAPKDALERNRLEMLSWLVRRGWLEVRVGLMRHTNGILHAKFGLVTDAKGDTIAFAGSDNETGKALVENYEIVSLGTSWQDPEFVAYYRESFDRLWNDDDEYVATVPLPEAVRLKLISWAPSEVPVELLIDKEAALAAMLWHFIHAAPYLPNGEYACDATALVEPWPHQRAVVADASASFPAGRLLCDEVGLGKTIEAILILRRLLAGRGVKRALLLVPAGLLKQWQEELREKGGLIVPYWENDWLWWPDGKREKQDAPNALASQDVLLLSREWARLADNRARILTAPRWDLVILDEAHAARRRAQVEREFNSANLLLELLRELQLRRQARGLLLLSATPMQTQPWEPWDLLTVLGVGAPWMIEFADVRTYYAAVATLSRKQGLKMPDAKSVAQLVSADDEFPVGPNGISPKDPSLDRRLVFDHGDTREEYSRWLRKGAPLGRRMHRNTRETLARYHELGLLRDRPPVREVKDVVFDYADARERATYQAIEAYITKRFEALEGEKPGKGFVMTIYRRRMASSPYALRRSLERRMERLERVIQRRHQDTWLLAKDEQLDARDLIDADLEEEIDPGIPDDPVVAATEKEEVSSLLQQLNDLGSCDTKLTRFLEVLAEARSDGRPALVFTEYADTLDYLAQMLKPIYGGLLGCYSGEGGRVLVDGQWQQVSKAEIAKRLAEGKLHVLLCTDAASEGLNLQAAGAVINYDLPWNPSKVEQRIGRADRIGQQYEVVRVRNMFLKDSVDMRVYTVLAHRCGLFTHFVGYMQPVLTLARSILRQSARPSEIVASLEELSHLADELQREATVVHAYVESEPAPDEAARRTPPITREDVLRALALLGQKGKVSARRVGNTALWKLAGVARARLTVSTDEMALAREPQVRPLGIVRDPTVEQLVEKLPLSAGTPLVLARYTQGPYTCAEARWVHSTGEIEVVASAGKLEALAEAWCGTPPPAHALLRAEREAHQAATERVTLMIQQAVQAERNGLKRQHEAARQRLLRELARTLAVISPNDLSETLRAQVRREGNLRGRYGRALQLLGGYPEWPPEVVADAEKYRQAMPEKDRNARIAGSEIDAALNDPRWLAAETLRAWADELRP